MDVPLPPMPPHPTPPHNGAPMTDTTDPARDLAAHIADQPVSVVQAALRHLGIALRFELQDLAAGQNTAETATDARESDEHPAARGQSHPGGANGPHTGADGLADAHAQNGIHTPGCNCGHHGMGHAWHNHDCTWRTTGPQTPAQDLEQWSAIINAEIDPDHAAQKLLALRDQDRATHDKWTRAVEQRNSRLRVELAQTRADVDHRDQSIRHLENGLRHERQALADARAHLNQVPNHHINSQVRADLKRRLEPAPADEVLPHELLRLLDMNRYVSTACDTAGACETAAEGWPDRAVELAEWASQSHQRCRRTHKFTGQPCGCGCHHKTAGDGERPPC